MLKVNVGLSRKISRDYNSTGFSINLEGELMVPLDDPEMVVEKVKELYDLAEESLHQQIDRYEGDSALASRDEPPRNTSTPLPRSRTAPRDAYSQSNEAYARDSNSPTEFTPATNKQLQFLLQLGKRDGLTKGQLEGRVSQMLGREVELYSLSKQEAGSVLDQMTASENGRTTSRR